MTCKLLCIGLLILLVQIFSCGKPPYSCDTFGDHSIEIKFVNQQGQNIVFGANAMFRIDSMRVHYITVRKGMIDSTHVNFFFNMIVPKSYIYYNQQTLIDSLEIKWGTKTAKCDRGGSLEVNVIDSVKFNNVYIKPVNGVYTFIK